MKFHPLVFIVDGVVAVVAIVVVAVVAVVVADVHLALCSQSLDLNLKMCSTIVTNSGHI